MDFMENIPSSISSSLDDPKGQGWLSTGEAADLLGVSRQHVVNLCKSGMLRYVLVGTHRRVRRVDVEAIAASGSRTTRDKSRSLLLGHAIAGRVAIDPVGSRALARSNLARMQANVTRGSTRKWLHEWERLLNGPLVDLLTALTSPSPRSAELRQNSPFAGLLSENERERVLANARDAGAR